MNTELFDKENWNKLLASYVINSWMNSQKSELPEWAEMLNLLGMESSNNFDNQLFQFLEQGVSFSSLAEELEKKVEVLRGELIIDSLEKKVEPIKEELIIDSLEKISYLEDELSSWYYGNYEDNNAKGCVTKLELRFQELRSQLRDKNQQFLNSFWASTSPRPCLKYLAEVESFLLNVLSQYELGREDYFKKEKGGVQSLARLYSKITKSQSLRSVQENCNKVINTLSHIYECRIKVRILTWGIEIVEALLRDNQIYIDNLIKSVTFLRKIKDSLEVDGNETDDFIIILAQKSLMNQPEDLCEELEKSLGYPLNKWGSSGYISEAEVKKKLLEKMTVITNNIYEKIKQRFTPIILSDNQELTI